MYRSVAVVFPGQGSQSVGMLADVIAEYEESLKWFARASEVLGYDLWKLIQDDADNKINTTEYTQPAILVCSVVLWHIWRDKSKKNPAVVAGHSLGEYSALVCSGVIDFEDAINIVRCRGQFMQSAISDGEGAMAAILGLTNKEIVSICVESCGSEFVAGVNFNSPGQVVIAGNINAVNSAMVLAKERGAKRVVILPINIPSHCKLMLPAATQLQELLAGIHFNEPEIDVFQNASCKIATSVQEIKDNLVQQLTHAVDWVQIMKNIAAMNIDFIIECGPGKILSALNKRIDPVFEVISMGNVAGLRDAYIDVDALGK